jgi:hypothetical protein
MISFMTIMITASALLSLLLGLALLGLLLKASCPSSLGRH